MNIYVGNLPYGVSDDELRELFEPFGSVSRVNIISDRETGRSKGFGFVEMADDSEGQRAIEELNGHSMDGRKIAVNEARPREERPQGGAGGGGGRGGFRPRGGGGGGGFNRGGRGR